MRITRLYHAEKLSCGGTTRLNPEASTHLIRVLRTKIDSAVILFNGDGFDYLCKTLDKNSRKALLAIESKTETNNESNLHITLIQGLSRNDRIETSIQKSVELGVNKIIPVICQRSNTKIASDKITKKLNHWRKVAISACEQSGRGIIPTVDNIISLDDLKQVSDENTSDINTLKIILNPESKVSLKDLTLDNSENNKPSIQIFIGPEGGLSADEINLLQKNNFIDVCFGPRILRTETAGPAVISALQLLWGDF